MILRLTPWLIALALPCLPSEKAAAATVESSSKPGCSIELSGPLVEGDFKKVLSQADSNGLLKTEPGPFEDNTEHALCLDSPGGDYIQGRMISQLVHDNGIATRVVSGAECYSSCAFIFMSGRVFSIEGDGPSRVLHVLGKLGFHAPYYNLDPDETFRGEVLMKYNKEIVETVSELISFSAYQSIFQSRPSISLSLIAEILSKGPTELAMIDTVEDVARWGISLDGNQESVLPVSENLKRACVNFQAWSLDLPSVGDPAKLPTQLKKGKLYGKSASYLVVDTGGMAARFCEVEAPTSPQSGVIICSTDEFSGISFGNCAEGWGIWVPWYHALHPRTPITHLVNK